MFVLQLQQSVLRPPPSTSHSRQISASPAERLAIGDAIIPIPKQANSTKIIQTQQETAKDKQGQEVIRGTEGVQPLGVRYRLKKNLSYWKTTQLANSFIISTIDKGYTIPFITTLPPASFSYNKSALLHSEFVSEAITELVQSGSVLEVPYHPTVINPSSVSVQSSGINASF
jgi:hypothetical protein